MEVYTTEEQQLAAIKSFFARHGKWMAILVVSVAVVIGGWQFWRYRVSQRLQAASTAYQSLLTSLQKKDLRDAKVKSEVIQKTFPNTPYAHWATLIEAKFLVASGGTSDAIKLLQKFIKSKPQGFFGPLARIQLARVFLQEKEPQKALDVLKPVNGSPFLPWAHEISGDAYVALEANEKAKRAYERALTELPLANQGRRFIQMKLDDLV